MSGLHALVLTFDAPTNALECARAIAAQSVRVQSLLVVENPGGAPVNERALQEATDLPTILWTLSDNLGPAGGYAAGIDRLRDADLLWILDDDLVPDPTCLERLLAESRSSQHHALVFPRLVDAATGAECSTWGWVGVLVPGTALRAVGLPNADLFYGSEDQDYLIDRCGQAGYPLVRVPEASSTVHRRAGQRRPRWHFYYLARNTVYQHLYQRKHVSLGNRMKRMCAALASTVGMVDGPARERAARYSLTARGILDGILQRMGRRIDPGRGTRPGIDKRER